MPNNYPQSTGGIWIRKDRNKRDYFYIQIDIGNKRYAFHAFINKYKETDKQPVYRVFPLDGGEPKAIEPRRERTNEDYKTQPPPGPEEEREPDDPTGDEPEEEDDDAPF